MFNFILRQFNFSMLSGSTKINVSIQVTESMCSRSIISIYLTANLSGNYRSGRRHILVNVWHLSSDGVCFSSCLFIFLCLVLESSVIKNIHSLKISKERQAVAKLIANEQSSREKQNLEMSDLTMTRLRFKTHGHD